MKNILLSSVALLGFSVAAQAADLPRRTMAPAPMVAIAPVFTWSGFYFGVNAGYGFSDKGEDDRIRLPANIGVAGGNTAGDVIFRSGRGDADGFLGGAQLGWNYQFTPGTGFVVGLEADIQGIDLDRDNGNTGFTFTGAGINEGNFVAVRNGATSLDWFGTVRGRIGYAFDRVLFYGTGGLAYGGGDDNNGCPNFIGTTFVGNLCERGSDDTRFGYAVGGGIEWALPVSNVSFFGSSAVTFGIEGLYVNLEDDDNKGNLVGFRTTGGGAPAPVFVVGGQNRNDETEFGLVRAKINFKF